MTCGTAPRRNATTGVPLAIVSIITSPNGSGQSIGNNNAIAPPKKISFSLSQISPMNSTPGPFSSRLVFGVVVSQINFVDLCRDFSRQPDAAGNLDRSLHTFLGADAGKKCEIAAVAPTRLIEVGWKPVMDGAAPICPKAPERAARRRSTPVVSLETRIRGGRSRKSRRPGIVVKVFPRTAQKPGNGENPHGNEQHQTLLCCAPHDG